MRAYRYDGAIMYVLRIPLQDHARLKIASSEAVSSCCRDGLWKMGLPPY